MKLLLDTNVVSELMREPASPAVLDWFARQPAGALFVSTITQAEMLLGAALLPPSRRRTGLEQALHAMFSEDFAGRVLGFDSGAATVYAQIVAARRKAGRPISAFDAQIAAIARQHGLGVATRNVADFEGCGLEVINPWAR